EKIHASGRQKFYHCPPFRTGCKAANYARPAVILGGKMDGPTQSRSDPRCAQRLAQSGGSEGEICPFERRVSVLGNHARSVWSVRTPEWTHSTRQARQAEYFFSLSLDSGLSRRW